MPATNQDIAAVFQQMADLMQILGHDAFRINAFARSARIIADLPQELADIGPDPRKLTAIEGIGKGTAERICEFLNTGAIKEHNDLRALVPPKLPELLTIPGLGPKTVALLWRDAGVDSIDTLRAKLQGDSLAALPGMGAKKIENLRKNVQFAAEAATRMRIGSAMPMALWIATELRRLPGVVACEFAGSLRRGRETVGDLDILVAAPAAVAPAVADAFVHLRVVDSVIGSGATKSSVRLRDSGFQADLRVVEPDAFGAALLYFTGSKEHNVQMRERAIRMGLKLSEYGLFRGEERIAGRTEHEVFKALGLAWIPPELREARSEIAWAEKNAIPRLIDVADIRAELHTHTTASDGKWTIRELAMTAADRGFHTLAITDHSKSQPIANGLSEERLQEHIVAVRKVAAELKSRIRVLAGTEVDILADGRLDYPNSLLKELDLVVASPHAALSQDPAKSTARLLKAIENPYVHIIGHPTGRLVGAREGLHPDLKTLFQAAAQRRVAMELNANSYRLDLRDAHLRLALDCGVAIAINTDAHAPADLEQLIFGVLTARRAAVTPDHVINAWPAARLHAWLKR